MSKAEKLLLKAINNPDSLSYKEFLTLLTQQGWKKIRQTGSHEQWAAETGPVLTIQNKNGMAKGYQVKAFLTRCGGGEAQ
jgi:predicted RNA binding protein YcfA (HicA-like mRNA interferase family)